MSYEQWNVPNDFAEMIATGTEQYSIIGVVARDNIDAMRMFIDAVNIPSDKIEIDGGTQLIVTHPDPAKIITIDAGGLGDFDRHGFDVAVVDREIAQ